MGVHDVVDVELLPDRLEARRAVAALQVGVAAMVGVVAAAVGVAILGSNGTCTGTLCSENRSRSALGGALIGAGAVAAVAGGYVTFARLRNGDPVLGVSMAFQF